MTKASDHVLAYNKISNDSHLFINVEFPTYLDGGTNGMGFRVRLSVDGGSNYLQIPDNCTGSDNGANNSQNSIWASWGLNGYGGHTADHLSCKYTTDSYTANADTIRTHTGEVRIYFEGKVHASGDTAYWISYSNSWAKAGYVYIEEVKN